MNPCISLLGVTGDLSQKTTFGGLAPRLFILVSTTLPFFVSTRRGGHFEQGVVLTNMKNRGARPPNVFFPVSPAGCGCLELKADVWMFGCIQTSAPPVLRRFLDTHPALTFFLIVLAQCFFR